MFLRTKGNWHQNPLSWRLAVVLAGGIAVACGGRDLNLPTCGALEVCDSTDNDCDGLIDEGVANCAVLCSAAEFCDGVDNDCDGAIDEGACGTGTIGPVPGVPTPGVPTPGVPTPGVPTPGIPRPGVPYVPIPIYPYSKQVYQAADAGN